MRLWNHLQSALVSRNQPARLTHKFGAEHDNSRGLSILGNSIHMTMPLVNMAHCVALGHYPASPERGRQPKKPAS
jgi:hypothetical protein